VVRSDNNHSPGRLLSRSFFEAAPERVAPRLLGKLLARRTRSGWIAGRIVELEAYLGPYGDTPDPAAHSHRGETPRNAVLFGPAGHAYVYFIYGQYYCMNFSCGKQGKAGGILLRALEPVMGLEQMAHNRGLKWLPTLSDAKGPPEKDGATARKRLRFMRELTSGPGRLCKALNITRSADNGLDVVDSNSPLQVRDDGFRGGRVLVTKRIGITHAVELPLRFILAGNPYLSGSQAINREGVFVRSTTLRRLKK
jgi:DNA-3-methyladenine glycosylase